MSAQSAAVWCCTSCGAVYHKDFARCPNDGAEVHLADRDPLLDQRFGQYVIDRLIGEGGMGRVYAAHHATLPAKRYAIKVLLGDVAATSSMRRRFAKEAESASRLDHPNIVHVLDFGEMPSGLPYIVMDYVDGVPLTTLFDGCPMDPWRVIQIARGVCEGLAYAHDHGVVHRDLKPDNIMVVIANDGREVPRIADFGLATTLDPAGVSRLTTTGMAMGTPAYAAPEQMAGKRVDGRADLYSLGMTMFEMLAGGKLPFEGHPLELMSAKAHRDAPAITDVVPGLALPPGLEELVGQLIRRKHVERPPHVRSVLATLDRIAAGAGHFGDAAPFDDPVDPDGQRFVRNSGGHRVIKTFEVRRRRARIWPWLLFTGCAFGGGIGWVHHRYGISSVLQIVDDVAKQIMGDGPGVASPLVQNDPSSRNAGDPTGTDPTPHLNHAEDIEVDSPGAAEANPGGDVVRAEPVEPSAAGTSAALEPPQAGSAVGPDPAQTIEHGADQSSGGGADDSAQSPPRDNAAVKAAASVPSSVASSVKKKQKRNVRPGEQVAKLDPTRSEGPPREAADPIAQPGPTQPVAVVVQAPAVVAPPVAAPAATPMLTAEIANLAVSGALSRALVRNAVERVMPAIRKCMPSAPKTERTQFTIDESRRAQNVRGTSGCIVAALGAVRIDTTPDVGDAQVDLQIRFVAKP